VKEAKEYWLQGRCGRAGRWKQSSKLLWELFCSYSQSDDRNRKL